MVDTHNNIEVTVQNIEVLGMTGIICGLGIICGPGIICGLRITLRSRDHWWSCAVVDL